ncbi:MAG: DUF5694 domain-containing protein [Thermoanaerobaculia bacterium]|nr:DUF5694 domain-containing protein [Thermoanaerobaculia bacterium]
MLCFSRLISVAACATILLPASSALSESEEFDPSRFGFGGPRAELLILGTFHFKDAGLDTYKPQHDVDILGAERQAELDEILDRLEAWGPTRIAVEWDRDEQARLDERYGEYLAGDFEISSNEIYQLGFRLGKRLGHERLWAVDADSRFYEPRVDREEWARQHGQEWIFEHPWHERFERLYSWEDERKTRLPLRETLLHMNSPERLAIGHGHYLVGGFKAGDGTDYPGADHLTGWWYVRNLRIVSNLLQLAREPDDKILFVVGAGHVPILRHAALSAPDVELIEVAEVLK